jgi:hypothetical protein
MKQILKHILLVIFLSSCSETSSEDMKKWFQWGTEIKLSNSAKVIEGKNYGLGLSDIYLKIKAQPDYFETISKAFVKKEKLSLDLPDNMPKLKTWLPAESELSYYEKVVGSVDEGGFITHLGVDSKRGIIYCHIQEYSP